MEFLVDPDEVSSRSRPFGGARPVGSQKPSLELVGGVKWTKFLLDPDNLVEKNRSNRKNRAPNRYFLIVNGNKIQAKTIVKKLKQGMASQDQQKSS